jgi:hypothetical protein
LHKCEMGHMNINDILTEIEYTKERSAKELFEFVKQKKEELGAWGEEQPKIIKYRELGKGLPDKFSHELTPFAYYANTYYGNKSKAVFKPCCDSEQYDGIIIDNANEVFVEFTNAIFGKEWAIQKELLVEKGIAPWAYDILGVNKKNRAEKKKVAINMYSGNEAEDRGVAVDCVYELKKLVKKSAENKCVKSLDASLPYGKNKTILIVTFDDTVIRSSIRKNDFADFKRTEIDSMKHNFRKIILFGWLEKEFIG